MPDIPIRFFVENDNVQELRGASPIVIIGPNGSGKSKHAGLMSHWNDADMIPAFRNIALSRNLAMRPVKQVEPELANTQINSRSQHWELASDIDFLFSKLIADNSDAAVTFKELFLSNPNVSPLPTKLDRLKIIWEKLFPGRSITFKDYEPIVKSSNAPDGQPYSARQMSDGERVALYLAARVLDSQKKVIIIDEPEVHFHSLLAVRFWTEMEAIRNGCRFVYVTHDLSFALSRKDATFLVLNPNAPPQTITLTEGLPKEIAESLLAAASFSIHARRIIFCEGISGRSYDASLYQAWFADEHSAVVAVESCDNVRRTARVFSESNLMAGMTSMGIIDSDYFPDVFLESQPDYIHVLPVHEVENLFCLPEVFDAVGNFLGIPNPNDRYDHFITLARSKFVTGLLNKQISLRFQARCKHQLSQQLHKISVDSDLEIMKRNHAESINPDMWDCTPTEIVNDEAERLANALNGPREQFLRYFPGKVFFGDCSGTLEISKERYAEIVCKSLSTNRPESMNVLGDAIAAALAPFLPRRDAPVVQ